MAWVVREFDAFLHGNILEIGIGHGSYCSLLRTRGQYLGIDIDAESVTDAQARFPGVPFAQCDILDLAVLRALIPEGANAVVMINVLEHIENDQEALANIIEVIKPGGHLLLSVPALMMLYNELDRLAGHYRRYTAARLRDLLGLSVAVVTLKYMNPIGGFGRSLNSVARPASLNSAAINRQILIFDRYILPISKILQSAISLVFRSISDLHRAAIMSAFHLFSSLTGSAIDEVIAPRSNSCPYST